MSLYRLGSKMTRIDVPENHAKNNLPLGTVCLFVGYGDHKYVIVKNEGLSESFPAYGARYTLVNVDTYSIHKSNASDLRPISEKFGIGVYLLPDEPVRPADEVLDLIEKAQQTEQAEKQAKQAESNRRQQELDSLPAKYPYLIQLKGSDRSSHSVGSANIKRELTRAFPGIKFNVRSDSFSGGDSIDVMWTGNPELEEVKRVIGKYEEGRFDGMTDSYEYNRLNVWPEVFGGAKYVHASRQEAKD